MKAVFNTEMSLFVTRVGFSVGLNDVGGIVGSGVGTNISVEVGGVERLDIDSDGSADKASVEG